MAGQGPPVQIMREPGTPPPVAVIVVRALVQTIVHRTSTRRGLQRPDHVMRFWRILVQVHRVLTGFLGKVSPVHFFWGSFDLAVTRFSGRTAPRLAGDSPNLGAWVMQVAYSHEVSSCGFWPGDGGFGKTALYSYATPSAGIFLGSDGSGCHILQPGARAAHPAVQCSPSGRIAG